ncbi:hypothetical protein [Gymnodinialimonas ulvae]|uniref:hypothetical protein n=1 Tax=Gymnodinialimonas ulvae TaxID=3126504 RepID=UPI0030AC458C
MDITNTPSRVELAVSPARADIRTNAGSMTGRAETKNPVTATDKTESTGAARQHETASQNPGQSARAVKPLDVFQVGDNDDIPPPPEPPRHPLAMLAMAPPDPATEGDILEVDSDADAAARQADATIEGPDGATGDTQTSQTKVQPSPPAPDPAAAAPEFYQSGAPEPINRTVDIRR